MKVDVSVLPSKYPPEHKCVDAGDDGGLVCHVCQAHDAQVRDWLIAVSELPERAEQSRRWALAEAHRHERIEREMALGRCESIIEESFLIEILDSADPVLRPFEQQVEIVDAPVDFLFGGWLIVELDGFRYHDRNQEAFAAQRRRDRATLRAGFITMRFAATEVLEHPHGCVAELTNYLRVAGTIDAEVIRRVAIIKGEERATRRRGHKD